MPCLISLGEARHAAGVHSMAAALSTYFGDVPGRLALAYGALWLACLVWLAWPSVRRFERTWQLFGLLAVLAIGTCKLADPWWHQHDFNGALFSVAARNLLRRGFTYTLGLDLWNGGTGTPVVPAFYAHHPPLISWLLAPAFAVFGVHESVARLAILIPFHAALFVMFRSLSRNGWTIGPIGGGLVASLPAMAYYARMPGHEPLAILLSALLVALAAGDGEGRSVRVAVGALAFLLVLSGWGGCFFAGTAGLVLLLARRWRWFVPVAIGAGGGGLLVLVLFGLHYHWNFQPLLEQFQRRSTAAQSEGGVIDSPMTWLDRGVARRLWSLIGPVPLALALVGAFRLPRSCMRAMILWLLGSAIGLVLILRQWAFVHEYASCFFALPVLLLALAALQSLARARPAWLRAVVAAAVLALAMAPAQRQVALRLRKQVGFQHAQVLGGQVCALTRPDDVIFLTDPIPSPVFLYYADRDFVIWPDAVFAKGLRPAAFVRLHNEVPDDPALAAFLDGYTRPAGVRDIWLRR